MGLGRYESVATGVSRFGLLNDSYANGLSHMNGENDAEIVDYEDYH